MSDTKKSTTRSYSSSKKSTASKKSSSAKKSTSSKNSSAKKNSSGKSSSKKSTSSKKSSSATKNTPANKAKSASAKKKSAAASKSASIGRTGSSNSWVREILFFVVIAFCVVEFISNLGTGGVVGSVLGTFFFGTFGVIAYIFPFWFFFFAAFWISNYGSDSTVFPKACLKSVAAILLLFFLSVFAHLVYFLQEQMPFREIYAACAADHVGGGVIGALIGTAFVKGFGLLLSFVLVIIILVIMVVLLRQRAIFAGVTKKSRQEAKEARRQRRLEEQKQKREKERREAERRRRQEAWERDRARQKEEPDYTYLDPQGGQVQGTEAGQDSGTGQPRGGTDRTQEFEMPGIYMPGERDAAAQSAAGEEPASGEELPWDEGDAPASAGERVQPGPEPVYERVQPETESFSEEEEFPEAFGEAAGRDGMSADEAAGRDSVLADGEDEAATQQSARQASAVRKKKAASDPLVNAMTAAEIAAGAKAEQEKEKPYVFPRVDLLSKGGSSSGDSRQHLAQMSQKLQMTLTNFGVNARVTNVTCGPSVTRYEIQPEMGVKVSKIVNLADDIKLNLAVTDIRIEAPIPGKAAIGIEVPNKHNVTVPLRELIESGEFQNAKSKLTFAAGKDIAGKIIVADIAKMPHVLIAGATGSGKSVCINSIIMSVLYKAKPDEVKMIMIDPKVVELSVYNGIPHLLLPVVTDPKKAAGALNWAVSEMTDRYRKFAEYHVRDMQSYNRKVDSVSHYEGDKPEKMPQILIIVDELADLMMAAPGDVEGAICRLAQLARAAGLHLVIATQRPSVNVITGLIKANMPSRIAFAVTSGVDSRTILDMNGAEKLLGKGDMLYYPQNYNKPLRVQGTFVSDAEVTRVVEELIRANGDTEYDTSMEEQVRIAAPAEKAAHAADGAKERDVYFEEAGRFVIEKEKGSIGMLQRLLSIGFNRAARIMDQLQEAGVVGPEEGTKARQVLMTAEEFEAFLQNEKL